jgi:hypothetical protein
MSDTTAGVSDTMLENIRASLSVPGEAAALRPILGMHGYFIAESHLGDSYENTIYLFSVRVGERKVYIYLRM